MSDGRVLVFFDLETTGLDTTKCEIIQVAAVHEERVFSVYILPSQPIDEGATKVTGFTVRDGKLFCHEDLKATTPLLEALQSFIAFLSSFRRPVLLVGHNARSFDAPILSRVLTQSSLLEPFREAASGTLDTLPVSRELFPDLQNHRQEFLVRRFLNKQYGAHNAVEDAKVLQELFKHWDIQDQTVWEKHVF
ncbi:uncharacterized protein plex9.1 [Salarias fasciatus]|uniref:uncharacterized protein plex9.1 n=1 Tax=Salarias fasciatus TaxID=181472 RepID=UPI001176B780|nr:uncharacterized protein LOC115397334 [Salarias fasciatus]